MDGIMQIVDAKEAFDLDTNEYWVALYGVDAGRRPVTLQVRGFQPFFFVRIEEGDNPPAAFIRNLLSENMWHEALNEKYDKPWHRKNYWFANLSVSEVEGTDLLAGFRPGVTTKLLKIACANSLVFDAAKRAFNRKLTGFIQYESNLASVVRFFKVCGAPGQVGKITPASTIRYEGASLVRKDVYGVHMNKISVLEGALLPMKVLAWDIECVSLTGGFPSPVGTQESVVNRLMDGIPLETVLADTPWELADGAAGAKPVPIVPADVARRVKIAQTAKGVETEERFNAIRKALFGGGGSVLPPVAGDPIVTIGMVFRMTDAIETTYRRVALCLNSVTPWPELDPATTVLETFDTELDLLERFCEIVRLECPDFIVDFNGMGFDWRYLHSRYTQLAPSSGGDDDEPSLPLLPLGRGQNPGVALKEAMTILASGAYDMKYPQDTGRVLIDLLITARRELSLGDYRLDTVASFLIRDKVVAISRDAEGNVTLVCKNVPRWVGPGNFVTFEVAGNSTTTMFDGAKFKVVAMSAAARTLTVADPDSAISLQSDLWWCLGKDDLDPKELFREFLHGGPDGRGRIAKYCLQDCELTMNIACRMETVNNTISMSAVTGVPMPWLSVRGQSIKLFSLVISETSKRNMYLRVQRKASPGPDDGDDDDGGGYEGAIVLKPKRGIYTDTPIDVLDFNSLYPSEMISSNLSYETLVTVHETSTPAEPPDEGSVTGGKLVFGDPAYDNLPGVTYTTVKYPMYLDDKKKSICGWCVCRYAQPGGGASMGIIPYIVSMLIKRRKDVKKELAACTDPMQASVLKSRELAYKVLANSMYGQTGASTSPIRMEWLAASTTAGGRRNILIAKKIAEEGFGADVIYGDSVTGDTPILIRGPNGRLPRVVRMDEIEGEWVPGWHDNKESIEMPPGVEVWSDGGWTALHRAIRHRLAPGKRMFRVVTNRGMVDVTEDHSLLLADGTEVRPSELIPNATVLLCSNPKDAGIQPVEIIEGLHMAEMLFQSKFGCFDWQMIEGGNLTSFALQDGWFRGKLDDNAADSGVPGLVTSVTELPTEDIDYVYDLTTANHHFHVGPGNLVVHNTDSIFVKFPMPASMGTQERLIESAARSEALAERINAVVRPPHHIEFEKSFFPKVLLGKKRYIGIRYAPDKRELGSGARAFMGIQLKRRDVPAVVKDVYGGALDILLATKDVWKARMYVVQQIKEILAGRYPFEKFVTSQSIRESYKSTLPAQKVLANRMAARNPAAAPRPGDRIQYVRVITGAHSSKKSDNIEEVSYVKERGLRIDYKAYVTELEAPILQLFSLAMDRFPEISAATLAHLNVSMPRELAAAGKDENEIDAKVDAARADLLRPILFGCGQKTLSFGPAPAAAARRG